MIVLKAVLQGW